MYLEQRIEKLEKALESLLAATEEKNTFQNDQKVFLIEPLEIDDLIMPAGTACTVIAHNGKYLDFYNSEFVPSGCTAEAAIFSAEEPKVATEEPKAEVQAEVQTEQVYTLDDVRAKVTEVMKADKSKKGALQALLKKHGADRVSELDESKFALVIDAIEKGAF